MCNLSLSPRCSTTVHTYCWVLCYPGPQSWMRHSPYSKAADPGSAGGNYACIQTLVSLQVCTSKAREENENNITLPATLCFHLPLQLNWAAFQTWPNCLRSHLTVPAGLGFWIESHSREARGICGLPRTFSLTQRRKVHFTSANLTNQSWCSRGLPGS